MVADFESIIVDDNHIPSGFCILLRRVDGTKILREYTGPDHVDKLIEVLEELTSIYHYKSDNPIQMITSVSHRRFKYLSQWKSIFNGKVGDHYHFTGKFRGMAHNKCNLKSRVPKEISVYFHNLSAHILVLVKKY